LKQFDLFGWSQMLHYTLVYISFLLMWIHTLVTYIL